MKIGGNKSVAKDLATSVKELMRKPTHIRNIAICAHIDIF